MNIDMIKKLLFVPLLLFSLLSFGQENKAIVFDWFVNQNSVASPVPPLAQSSEIVFSNVGRNELTLSLTRGDGQAVLVVARLGEPVTEFPIDGQSYTASSVIGEGDQVGIGNFVIHNGDGDIGEITGLNPGDEIFIRAFERNGTIVEVDASALPLTNPFYVGGGASVETLLVKSKLIYSESEKESIWAEFGF